MYLYFYLKLCMHNFIEKNFFFFFNNGYTLGGVLFSAIPKTEQKT